MANDWDLDDVDDNQTIKSIRDHAKALERQLKAQERELETLRSLRDQYESDARRAKTAAVFTEVGLSEKHATLFAALNPDVEPDAETVKAFAEEYGLAIARTEGDDDKLKAEEDPGFSPVTSGQPTDKRRYSSEEWWTLQRENPAAALQAVKDGRVDLAGSLSDLEKG